MRGGSGGNDTSKEKVDVVRFAAAQGACKFITSKGGNLGYIERVAIPGRVQRDVGLDEFCELDWNCLSTNMLAQKDESDDGEHTCITCFAGKGQNAVLVKCACLVV